MTQSSFANSSRRPRSSVLTSRRILAVTLAVASVLSTFSSVARAEEQVLIRGGGFGHGMGLSQYGAYGMATKGASSGRILRHYYQGVDVTAKAMPQVRVGLLQYETSIGMSSNGNEVAFQVSGAKELAAKGGPSASFTLEPSSTGRIRLYKNGKRIGAFGSPSRPLLVRYEEYKSSVEVFDKGLSYRHGSLEVGSYSSSSCGGGYCLRLVATLPMQQYLYGLGEVPASWPQAVLQAQAISGRTYAYRKINAYGQHRSPCDCAVVDSTYDQVFVGDAKRITAGEYWDDWKRAVDVTDRKVILYNGAPIEALYSSSSGGFTEDNENVWGGTPIPYLRGVKDPGDKVSINPNHQWSLQMSRSELSSKLNAYYGTGTLKKLQLVKPFGISGRVTVVKENGGGVRIVGSSRTVRVSGWSLRSALGLKDTLFRIEFFFPVWQEMVAKYNRLNGEPGLGKSSAYIVPQGKRVGLGRAQKFERGRMTWVRETDKAFWHFGQVLKRYDRLGRERSALGMPASDVWGPEGVFVGTYANGMIVWSEGNGAHPLVGKWADTYRSKGGIKGKLGLPLSGREEADSLPKGGLRQRFEDGRLYAPPGDRNIYALWGEIREKYTRIGEAKSACGYPTSHVRKIDGGLRARFANGSITLTQTDGIVVACSS